ncbi:hypothetical protein M413DRAFT_288929 [Hebeloma cylindrosporum]|uniref:Uncharacterized protein n=1 Tax=Hebeloma cylindrosporum TaxID=76867 RepID=A0A0C3BWV2_HEBCY|nr:hypothetical protein M413DRAFT_288929 [Hebeloma cylindrosporum h7]
MIFIWPIHYLPHAASSTQLQSEPVGVSIQLYSTIDNSNAFLHSKILRPDISSLSRHSQDNVLYLRRLFDPFNTDLSRLTNSLSKNQVFAHSKLLDLHLALRNTRHLSPSYLFLDHHSHLIL